VDIGVRHLPLLGAPLVLSLLAGGCSGTLGGAAAPRAAAPVAAAPGPQERMRHILSSPPDLSWEASALLPQGDYWHVPGGPGSPGFFLSRNGFHYTEPEDYALSYERTEDGFTLVEVKKRSGKKPLDQCPAFIDFEDCVETHSLLLATKLSCVTNSSCTYRFVVFDAYSPYLFLRRDHALAALKKRLTDGWSPAPDIDVKFEETGVVFDTDLAWAGYIADRFAFIAGEIRAAQVPEGFTLRSPPSW
jgi:hypothetical protein